MATKREIKKDSFGIRFSVEKDNKEVGWVYLYIITDHESSRSFGIMENLFVDENYRRFGLGKELVESVKEEAKKRDCFKLVFICDNQAVHDWYQRMGFKISGTGFRIDF